MPPKEKTTTEEGDSKQDGLPDGKEGLPVLRTFKSDSSQYIKKEGISMVDVATAEAKKGFGSFAVAGPNRSLFTKRNIILAGAVLIIAGAGFAGLLVFSKKEAAQPAVISLPKPVLTADFEKEATFGTLLDVTKEPVKENKLLYLAVINEDGQTKRLATASEFFSNFGVAFPGDISDIFEENFMLSVYNSHPSLIFKVKSYEKVFISMMKWEGNMAGDLRDIFMIKDVMAVSGSFADKVIKNHDVRILNDSQGIPIISYSFINKEYLAVSAGEDALEEIIRRFSLPQYLNR